MAYKRVLPQIVALALAPFLAAAQHPPSATDTHLLAAQTAQKSGDYTAAEREYLAVLALNPGYAEVHMNLGLAYQLQGHIPEAMAQLRQAVALKPQLLGANLMLGIDYCKLNQSAEAIRYLSQSIALDQTRVEAYSWLATAEEISGDYDAELSTIQRALQLHPENIDLQYLEGHSDELLGRSKALEINTSGANTGLSERLLAESYATSTEWPSAVAHFQAAIAASPERSGLHAELGEVLLRAGRSDQAEKAFIDELHRNPRDVRALVGRGTVRLLAGDLDSCLADWSHALAVDTTYTQHLFRRDDLVSESLRMSPSAASTLQTLDSLRPQLSRDNRLVAQLAMVYIARWQGQDAPLPKPELWPPPPPEDQAEICAPAHLQIALASGRLSAVAACGREGLHSKVSPEDRLVVARSLLDLGEYELALKQLDESPRLNPDTAERNYIRARCYEELSTAAYLKLYRLDPNSFRVHQLMGDLAAAREDDTKSIEEYRAAISLNPRTPNLHYSLAHVLWKHSDIPAARIEYAAELAITPSHIGALHDLGQTCLMEHESQQALSWLNQAVAAGGKGSDLDRDLGTAYTQLGQYRNAEAKYKLALSNDYDGSIHFKLAAVYRALGEKNNAMRESAAAADLNRSYHLKREEQTPQLKAIVE